MKRLAMAVLVSLVPALSVAQAPPAPEELGKFDVLIGSWEGSGTSRPVPGGPEIPWTSVATVKKILDGRYVQEDVRIDMGEEVPAPLVLRTTYAWDPASRRFRYFGVTNVGTGDHGTAYWTADGRMVGSSSRLENGVPVTHRWVYEFPEKDSFEFRIDGSRAGGEFFAVVTGSYRRGESSFSAGKGTGDRVLVPPAGQMGEVESQLGRWTYQGTLHVMPGSPALSISGRERVEAILGGHVHMSTIEGDPVEESTWGYRGRYYLFWDTPRNCYTTFGFGNFGDFGTLAGHLLGGKKMIYTGTRVRFGVPHAERTVAEWNEDATRIRVVSHRLAGDSPPEKSFESEMKRVEE